jgi:hypothetical protein
MPLAMMRARPFVVRSRSAAPRLRWVAVLASLVALGVPAGTAVAATAPHAHVVPPVGPLYDVLSAAWWTYAVAQPAATNPLLDTNTTPEADCHAGQAGPVFFLVGRFGDGPLTRDDCTVPANRALFFPLFNVIDIHVPESIPGGDPFDTPELLWAHLAASGFAATSLYASVDGFPIGNLNPSTTPYRACVGPVAKCFPRSFSVTIPDDDVFGATTVPAGKYAPAVADGFYLLLAPLEPGMHTITFGGTGTAPTQDITYHLRVL